MSITIKATPATVNAAKFACECQDAVNGRALLSTLLRHIDEMSHEADNKCSGDIRNQHPVMIAVLDKLASLARVQSLGHGRIGGAHFACADLAQGKDIEWEIV